jgi:hypothetical protein
MKFRLPRTQLFSVLLVSAALLAAPVQRSSADVRTLLERQTQELMDAIAAGNRDPWQRYLHDNVVVTAEDGRVWRKKELLADLRPFPKELWGTLKVTDFQVERHGSTAIATYVNDEQQGYYGQTLRARYRVTDTWIETRDGWQLVASQVLALRDDPPAITLPAGKLDEYVGTYSLTPDITYTIERKGDQLIGQRTGRDPEMLEVEVADYLFVPGQPRLRKVFQRNADGAISGFVERRESWDITWRRIASAR